MKFVKRILFFFSLFLLYIIIKEAFTLYQFTHDVHPVLGIATLIAIAVFIIIFIMMPVFQIIRIPRNYAPVKSIKKVPGLIEHRMRNFRNSPYLRQIHFDLDAVPIDEEGYIQVIKAIKPEAERIRKKYVTQLFYSTSIAQNGFLDAILILSSSVNLVKDFFILYHGRVSNKDLLAIARRVYYSMAIGGSEGVEYATEEIFSKLTAGGIKSIPFASKILGSIADGFVNAALLNRISFITENYCKRLCIDSERDLYPSFGSVLSSTKIITSDLIEKLISELKVLTRDKTSKIVLMTVNPVGYLIGSAMGRMAATSEKMTSQQRAVVRESAAIAQNPFGFAVTKIGEIFKKKQV